MRRAMIELGGKRKPSVNIQRHRPSGVEREIRGELVDLGNQALFDVPGVVSD